MDDRRPILITGIHRSGTTIVGRLLSGRPGMGYVDEPFNRDRGILGIDRWYPYISNTHPDERYYRDLIDDLLAGRATYRIPTYAASGHMLLAVRAASRAKRQRHYRRAVVGKRIRRVLIKDPLAALASEYLHRRFHMQTVVMVRHPAAFAHSVARMQWRFDFDQLRRQTALVDDHLSELADVIDQGRAAHDIHTEAAAAWCCVYHVLSRYLDRNPRMMVVRHEDFAAHPVDTMRSLHAELALPFDADDKSRIRAHTDPRNPADAADGRPFSLYRDSRALAKRWHMHLTPTQIDRIREVTQPVAQRYYRDEDWT